MPCGSRERRRPVTRALVEIGHDRRLGEDLRDLLAEPALHVGAGHGEGSIGAGFRLGGEWRRWGGGDAASQTQFDSLGAEVEGDDALGDERHLSAERRVSGRHRS
jgi:hypothetical protein